LFPFSQFTKKIMFVHPALLYACLPSIQGDVVAGECWSQPEAIKTKTSVVDAHTHTNSNAQL
jgi:hypothetical protein